MQNVLVENSKTVKLTVADAVWIATALLQRNDPQHSFSTETIVAKVNEESLSSSQNHVIAQHVRQHCVANRPPQPNNLRMLTAHGRGNRTLYREGDQVNPGREKGRMRPAAEDIPVRFRELVVWYEQEWNHRLHKTDMDPLLALLGSGKSIWKMDAVAYTDNLREEAI